ncbi:MAG: DUF423 domain-containing protein [Bacilli bacterium]|nr:DUF423 domain-containing protein [Bacilli bacterium]
MNKLKSRLTRARSLISIKTYKRPMLFVILLMVLLNLLILSIAALIALFIDDSFSGFIDAFANGSLKWMLTPNAILAIDNPKLLILAVSVLVTGLILFSGTIIALTTNAIKDYFQQKKNGSGKIYLENHIVILNWNNKVPELVADLLNVQNREFTVMILADVDKVHAEKQIVNTIRKSARDDKELANLNVLVKSGDPLIQSDLQDISIAKAKTILIMNKDIHQTVKKDMPESDLNVIKVILNLGRIEFENNPPIVAEIKNIETKTKILTLERVVHTLHEHVLLPICFDRRLGQIIAQTIINPLMEDVYLSLFSFEGVEVYAANNVSFEDALARCSHSFPIATINGKTFMLALNEDLVCRESETRVKPIPVKVKAIDEMTDLDVYIIGRNNKLDFILEAFRQYEKMQKSSFRSHWVEESDLGIFVKEINALTRPATLVLLSEENQNQESLDANVIDNLIYLEGHLKKNDVNIIVELLDPRNDHIIKDFNIRNTIISNKIISLLLSKLALYKETAVFYENLLTIAPNNEGDDDQSIIIKSSSEIINEELPIIFASQKELIVSLYEAYARKIMPLGYFRDSKLRMFSGNLNDSGSETLQGDDLLVFMKL